MSCQLKVVDLNNLPPAEEILGAKESAFFQTLRFPKRRTEWLGGRFALKELVQQATGADKKEIEILPQPSGKPLLRVGGKDSPLAFSITHSHGFAVAGLAKEDTVLGIDLEKTAHRIEAWAKDFFHPTELTEKSDTFLTALWTQKEALVKVLGTGLSLNSYDVRCVNGHAEFYGPALAAYEKLGRPALEIKTWELVPGFMFTQACGKISPVI
ncbi:4'-phosphopantetheinyl transferase family protein [Candidatus Avelusimicrobium stercoris]|uniref:4'-phosphopantetheinyl transferase family protein n=1 Tax=Candidatus Avelusimicrobium stercoris TaxID=1947924 RepID=UPI003D1128F2